MRKALLALLVLAAIRLDADVTFAPAAPTSDDVITATIDILPVCDVEAQTVVAGNVVRTITLASFAGIMSARRSG
jgi:energy-converting hydrogenase Eha subunit B